MRNAPLDADSIIAEHQSQFFLTCSICSSVMWMTRVELPVLNLEVAEQREEGAESV